MSDCKNKLLRMTDNIVRHMQKECPTFYEIINNATKDKYDQGHFDGIIWNLDNGGYKNFYDFLDNLKNINVTVYSYLGIVAEGYKEKLEDLVDIIKDILSDNPTKNLYDFHCFLFTCERMAKQTKVNIGQVSGKIKDNYTFQAIDKNSGILNQLMLQQYFQDKSNQTNQFKTVLSQNMNFEPSQEPIPFAYQK